MASLAVNAKRLTSDTRRIDRPCASMASVKTWYAKIVILCDIRISTERHEREAFLLLERIGEGCLAAYSTLHRNHVELKKIRNLVRHDAALLRAYCLLYANL